MITLREAKNRYRTKLRLAVHFARKGDTKTARYFFAMAMGIISVIGMHNVYRPRRRTVGVIVGTYAKGVIEL